MSESCPTRTLCPSRVPFARVEYSLSNCLGQGWCVLLFCEILFVVFEKNIENDLFVTQLNIGICSRKNHELTWEYLLQHSFINCDGNHEREQLLHIVGTWPMSCDRAPGASKQLYILTFGTEYIEFRTIFLLTTFQNIVNSIFTVQISSCSLVSARRSLPFR